MRVENIFIAGNRGPCGGVNMALEAADQVLTIVDGREPVYTPWDIVHNTPVMDDLRKRGLVNFESNWNRVPDRSIVFKPAHGGPPSLDQIAADKGCLLIDVTCPLVVRVQNMAIEAQSREEDVIYVGALNHPEPAGVLGRLDPQRVHFIHTPQDFQQLNLDPDQPTIVLSQTTMSMGDVGEIYELAGQRPNITIPPRSTICYATDTRQSAVDAMLAEEQIDLFMVVGSLHSHNSQALVEVGRKHGVPSMSVDTATEMPDAWAQLNAGTQPQTRLSVGLTSGASVPDALLVPVVKWFTEQYPGVRITWLDQVTKEANRTFRLPETAIQKLRDRYAAKV